MKKILTGIICALLMANFALVYAASYTSNASPAVVDVSMQARQEITFPFPTRNLIINNNDANCGIWVNLKGGDNNGYSFRGDRVYIAPSGSLELYDFVTAGLSIFTDDKYANADSQASGVSVIATY